MSPASAVVSSLPVVRRNSGVWRDVVQPREHGSWSLALEPVALGLLAVPSIGGAALGVAIVAGFLARRPLKISRTDPAASRRGRARRALLAGGLVAVAGLLAATFASGAALLIWLVPSGVAGAIFLAFDLRRGGREEPAELAGAVAFSCLPGALAVAGGAPAPVAAALACAMLARAVPTVLLVRACVRGAKAGRISPAAALIASAVAAGAAFVLSSAGLLPVAVTLALGLLLGRAALYARWPAGALRARTLGIAELLLGIGYVVTTAVAWRH